MASCRDFVRAPFLVNFDYSRTYGQSMDELDSSKERRDISITEYVSSFHRLGLILLKLLICGRYGGTIWDG